jgi:hypothetical protein
MALAVEVARVTGWRLANFPFRNCRDVPFPPPSTLTELLDNTIAYAKSERQKILKELRNKKKKKT